MNLPICGATGLLVFTCLDLKVPRGTIKEKLLRLDWTCVRFASIPGSSANASFRGNFLVVASTAAVVIALTWGGVKFPWSSAQVLAPLIAGIIGLCVFILYEIKYAENPLVRSSRVTT